MRGRHACALTAVHVNILLLLTLELRLGSHPLHILLCMPLEAASLAVDALQTAAAAAWVVTHHTSFTPCYDCCSFNPAGTSRRNPPSSHSTGIAAYCCIGMLHDKDAGLCVAHLLADVDPPADGVQSFGCNESFVASKHLQYKPRIVCVSMYMLARLYCARLAGWLSHLFRVCYVHQMVEVQDSPLLRCCCYTGCLCCNRGCLLSTTTAGSSSSSSDSATASPGLPARAAAAAQAPHRLVTAKVRQADCRADWLPAGRHLASQELRHC